ncbi:hypothetical protein [Chamaesiphon minutus]|uniref:hypothetical protein n=1 Tax=Chamaesiphon minutus TaxID=1173032 RepID=UPI0002F1A5F0|nr:hypothetical protein [Chamaesiphon minutus]
MPGFLLDRQMQAIECKVFEPYEVKTLHLISGKRLKNLAVKDFLRSSASPKYPRNVRSARADPTFPILRNALRYPD